ncbi:MAG: hypothetical protein CME62_17870 [Halobacteriovoraceae bacterium]|nr:hypothetical protein [Halobacteriovoraceae bacterium]|tara:strand:+ start:18144 stop:19202 length:1059 start_codon:yes stop_codon:yes gene_type:complete
MTKKIVFFNTNVEWGGGEKWHFTMANLLKDLGIQVHFITAVNSVLLQRAKDNELHVHPIKSSNLSFLHPSTRKQIKRILSTLNPDAVIFNSPRDLKLGAVIAKKAGVKKVIYRRGMPHPIKNTFLNRYIYQHIDIIIANSEEIKKQVIKNIPSLSSKVHIIYNGVEPHEKRMSEIQTPVRLGNLARLVDQKGHDMLIKVAKGLKENKFDFKLIIAGTGPNKELIQNWIDENKLGQHVELVGHQKAEEFFPQIDMFIFTSLFEGSANALVESLQYQIPAITFDISSMSEVVENNTVGKLIPPFDCEAMAREIMALASDSKRYQQYQNNCYYKVLMKFDIKEKSMQLLGLIYDN